MIADDLSPKQRVAGMVCELPESASWSEIQEGVESLMILDEIKRRPRGERTYTMEEAEAHVLQRIAEWNSKSSSQKVLSQTSTK